MANLIKRRSVHSGRIERWLGRDGIARAQTVMLHGGGLGNPWYGPPINCIDLPGSVWLGRDGDFVGTFERGGFHSAMDSLEAYAKRLWRVSGERPAFAGAGFASVSDALSRASAGNRFWLNGTITKTGTTGVANVTSSLWGVGSMPTTGATPSATPSGNAPTSATTGAMAFTNPASGTSHLTGADMYASLINSTLLLYDRIFHVAKTMNSASAEAVTGVPTRYQSTTSTDEDWAGGNFVFAEVRTALPATAHSWTNWLYTDESGNASQVLPNFTGNASAIANRLDHPTFAWFAPLAAGDQGIKLLEELDTDAAIATGAINVVIGHPIGFMFFPQAGPMLPFDWLTNKSQAPRIFNDACLAMLEVVKPATTATTYSGRIEVTVAA